MRNGPGCRAVCRCAVTEAGGDGAEASLVFWHMIPDSMRVLFKRATVFHVTRHKKMFSILAYKHVLPVLPVLPIVDVDNLRHGSPARALPTVDACTRR